MKGAYSLRQTRRSSLRDAIVTAIGDRGLLMVLDNFQHVAKASSLVGDLVVSRGSDSNSHKGHFRRCCPITLSSRDLRRCRSVGPSDGSR
jgi:hypothetical protein